MSLLMSPIVASSGSGGGGGSGIGGTINQYQIAVGSGANTISGSSDLRWQSGNIISHNGVDQNYAVGPGFLISSGVAIASFNDAASANVPMEYRATRHYFVKSAGELGNVSLRSQAATFPITIGDTLGPENDNSYDIGDSGHRIKTFFGVNADLSQDATIGRNLIFTNSSENLLSAGIQLVNAGSTLINWVPSAGLVWKNGATGLAGDRMYLTSDGKLGIGTTTPAVPLEVVQQATYEISRFRGPIGNGFTSVYEYGGSERLRVGYVLFSGSTAGYGGVRGINGLELGSGSYAAIRIEGKKVGFLGAMSVNRKEVSADYTATVDDYCIAIMDTAASRTMTLPSAVTVGNGFVLIFKDGSGGAGINNITIAPTGGQTIDGAASKDINTNWGSLTLVSTGSNWEIH